MWVVKSQSLNPSDPLSLKNSLDHLKIFGVAAARREWKGQMCGPMHGLLMRLLCSDWAEREVSWICPSFSCGNLNLWVHTPVL